MKKIFLGIVLSVFSMCAMENGKEEVDSVVPGQLRYHAIIMPGQNGLGGGSFVAKNIINTEYTRFETNSEDIDFGQTHCIEYFSKQMGSFSQKIAPLDREKKPQKVIFCGVSQGTATLLNWLARREHKEQESITGAIVLEAVLGTPSSAICHTVKNFKPMVSSIPGSRYWLPLAAKFKFPSYNPYGINALESAEKISPNIPVIIMHNRTDQQLSINDARKLYCVLRKKSDRVYLIESNLRIQAHIDILAHEGSESALKKIGAIQAIYKKYGLPYYSQIQLPHDLSEFQPSIEEVQVRIEEFDSAERSTISSSIS